MGNNEWCYSNRISLWLSISESPNCSEFHDLTHPTPDSSGLPVNDCALFSQTKFAFVESRQNKTGVVGLIV